MATLFETAMRGYQIADEMIKESRGYQAAREKYGDGPASDPGLFSALQEMDLAKNRDARAERQTQIQERQDARSQGSYDTEQSTIKDDRQKEATLNLVNGLREARDKGEDIGAAFDALADTLPGLGVSKEDLPAMKEELLKNPAILDQYYEALTGGDLKNKGKGSTKTGPNGKPIDTAAIESEITKFDDVLYRIDLLQDPERQEAAKSILGLPGMGVLSGGFGQYGSIPGSGAADYVSDLEALQEGDIRAIAFETLKGGGQITEKESEFARDAIARLSRATSYEKYVQELQYTRDYISRLQDAARRRLNGENVPEIPRPGNLVDTKGEGEYRRADGTGEHDIATGWVSPEGDKFVGTDPSDPTHWEDKNGNRYGTE